MSSSSRKRKNLDVRNAAQIVTMKATKFPHERLREPMTMLAERIAWISFASGTDNEEYFRVKKSHQIIAANWITRFVRRWSGFQCRLTICNSDSGGTLRAIPTNPSSILVAAVRNIATYALARTALPTR